MKISIEVNTCRECPFGQQNFEGRYYCTKISKNDYLTPSEAIIDADKYYEGIHPNCPFIPNILDERIEQSRSERDGD